MLNSLKRTLLASLGAVAFTRDRLKGIIEDLVAKGELTREQGKKLFETLIERGEAESEEISNRLFSESASLRDLFPITRHEFQKLVDRVAALEGRLEGSEDAATAPGATAAPPTEFPGEALPPNYSDS